MGGIPDVLWRSYLSLPNHGTKLVPKITPKHLLTEGPELEYDGIQACPTPQEHRFDDIAWFSVLDKSRGSNESEPAEMSMGGSVVDVDLDTNLEMDLAAQYSDLDELGRLDPRGHFRRCESSQTSNSKETTACAITLP